MRQFKTHLFLAALAVLGLGLFAFFPHGKKLAPLPAGFALVELFTSEGCSSCPPADALVAEIQKESLDKPVYVLAYHVDYWDHQGWKDAFSSPVFSQRQKDYSNWLGTQEVYTPQVVVNGQRQLVGSDERALRSAVGQALADGAGASVELSAVFASAGSSLVGSSLVGSSSAGGAGVSSAGSTLSVSYRVDGGMPADQLLVAVVEKSAMRKIGGGENGGRTLSHVQIVRELQKVALATSTTGSVALAVPAGFDTANWEVVGFLQNGRTGVVEAASRAVFASASAAPVKNIVIVHGAFADASGWEDVYHILKRDGYNVTLVQNPLTSLDADVAATTQALNKIDGPAVLVGHSWAGAVITQAGVSPKVASLVYVAAFVPDEGQSVIDLSKSVPMMPKSGILPPDENGIVYFDKSLFHDYFAGDLPKLKSDFMADAQQPIAAVCFGAPVTQAAWKTKPVYGIVATEDKAINPDLERAMYKHAGAKVTELKSCHVVFMVHPEAVAKVIETAASSN